MTQSYPKPDPTMGIGTPVGQPAEPGHESCIAQLTTARLETEEFKDKYLRLAAEIDNNRKQTERLVENRFAQEKRRFLNGFLEVADSLERALTLPSDTAGVGLHQGVKLAFSQLQQEMARSGVEPIVIRGGDNFDPKFHEAVEMRQGKVSEAAQDTVAEVVRSGYLYEGVLFRPAQVIVTRGWQ